MMKADFLHAPATHILFRVFFFALAYLTLLVLACISPTSRHGVQRNRRRGSTLSEVAVRGANWI